MAERIDYDKMVDHLVQWSYDSGYYSGQHKDGSPEHKQAIELRESQRRIVLKHLRQIPFDGSTPEAVRNAAHEHPYHEGRDAAGM